MFRKMTEEGKSRHEFLPKKGQSKSERKKVKRLPLDGDEPWCICFEQMTNDENLTYCKYGCGQNIHMTWAKHLVKHKQSDKKQIKCPLCRTNWGENALEELKQECKIFRANRMAEENSKLKEELSKNMPRWLNWSEFINHWYQGISNFGGPMTIRIFNCTICKNKFIWKQWYEQKRDEFKELVKRERRTYCTSSVQVHILKRIFKSFKFLWS